MFIRVGNKYINHSKILFFERTDDVEMDNCTIQIFFSNSIEKPISLESKDAQNFLDYLNEIDDIYPSKSTHEIQQYRSFDSTDENKKSSDIENSDNDLRPHSLEILKQQIQSIKMRMEQKMEVKYWDIQKLRGSAENIHFRAGYYSRKSIEKYSEAIKEVQSQAFHLADEAEVYIRYYTIDKLLTETIINVQSLARGKQILFEACSELEKLGKLTEEYKQKTKNIKEQYAWFRAKKKIGEAEVAISVGNIKKAQNLYKEATVVIKQDWSVFFPGEEPPVINQPFSKQLEL
ncbi:hypothetical protein GlitD10_1776 [Gloeomargarita lithophora Alchichica-D10]|uniref:Uncharacterized protein n=2 Tax=Gloeomargarita TaxID=1188227 RepID=A0A1J0ADT1_9CYAN|nr:hypothetical protein GlitD10_1776 [Gloeomargarita lithophora Alchichica-D10]